MSTPSHSWRRRAQPSGAQILRRREVEKLVGLARSTIYSLVKRGQFPRPIRLTDYAVGWRATDVEDWIASRPMREDAADQGARQ
jgi:prophage regulatory protein